MIIVNWIRFETWEDHGWVWSVPWRDFVHTRCKHSGEPCERCGTTDHRDVRHTTRGGRGCVARL